MQIITAKDIKTEIPDAVSAILRRPEGFTIWLKEYASVVGITEDAARWRVSEGKVRSIKNGRIRIYKQDVVKAMKEIYPQYFRE